ncbi:GNAT family N-acetyltransferase [Deinococcus sp. KNUC1210]|nr:GNAT family N-acetyltransferase [Deinococcus sp. KNUC1210]
MSPNPERIRAALSAYADNPERQVWSWNVGGQAVCAAGLHVQGERAEVLQIGTRPGERGKGYGRSLLLTLTTHLHLTVLEAETDAEAVGFYLRAGFQVQDAPPRFGTPRFHCRLTRY